MNNHDEKHMYDLVAHSNAMLDQAESGHWENVSKAERARRLLLNKLFADPSANAGVPEINETIEKIIAINRKLEDLAIAARDKAKLEMDKITYGRRAVNSYAKHI